MNQINLAIQILPCGLPKPEAYACVDAAIAVIHNSGLVYKVCPFETVIEGSYDAVMLVVQQAQEAAIQAGATDIIVNMKLQRSSSKDVYIQDKLEKYS